MARHVLKHFKLLGEEKVTESGIDFLHSCEPDWSAGTRRTARRVPWWSVAALPRPSVGPGSSCRWFPPAGRWASCPGFCCLGRCLWCGRTQSASTGDKEYRGQSHCVTLSITWCLFVGWSPQLKARTVCDSALVRWDKCVSLGFNWQVFIWAFCSIISMWGKKIHNHNLCSFVASV